MPHVGSCEGMNLPLSTDARLIIPFYPAACCTSGGGGLSLEPSGDLPAALAARGVHPDEWESVLANLRAAQRGHFGFCCSFLLCISVLGIPLLCSEEAAYQRRVGKWVAETNAVLFDKRGMHCRLQTVTVVRDRHEEEYSWLAIALTPSEAAGLRSEPTFWRQMCCTNRFTPDTCASCKCCCGVRRAV